MLSVNPASSGSCASSATDNSNIAAFVSQNSIGILAVVPSSPTSVVAVSGNASLAVTWAAPASTGGSAITNYLVKYSSNGGAAWTNFIHPVSIVPSLTVTGLANGTSYVIKVIARNAIGISLPSVNSAPATPAATVPGIPTSVVAVRGNASLAVMWVAPASNGGSNIIEYIVKYSSNNGAAWTRYMPFSPITATSCTVTGLTNGTAYVIKVIARNAIGISLPSVNSAPVTPALLAMSRVTVGNVGNAADAGSSYPGYGAVPYFYQIGAYDVTGSQYTAFLNAVGSADNFTLYNSSMGTDPLGDGVAQISRSGRYGRATYAVLNNTGERPITNVSWFDIARFANWMSNGQPSGNQTSTTTENGAYNVNGATTGSAVAKNATNPNTGSAPTFRIPLENEWYKAAYYSPNYGGAGVGGYSTYATQSNVAPGTTIGGSANQANYNDVIGRATDVGSFSGSGSFYGTFDQSGNVFQWNDLDGTGDGPSRGVRGGDWYGDSFYVSSSFRYGYDPSLEIGNVGFRLASPI
jgi:formylglycine-generating enzyme required for sulfatase activity